MLVTDLLIDLHKKFPRSPVDAWEDQYRAALAVHEGPALHSAYDATMRRWAEMAPPKPAHIAANLPDRDGGKTAVERLAKADVERLGRQRLRMQVLLETAERECAGYLDQPWSLHARVHLRTVCLAIAQGEAFGQSLGQALARFNAHEWRGGHPARPPDVWLDEIDAAIFAKRHESQQRVLHGRGSGVGHRIAAAWRRDGMRGRIIDELSRNAEAKA